MNGEELREYIAELRTWLRDHGAPFVPSDQAPLLAGWRAELATAERLLDARPEIPIAFLGPSQQGKSSLINALLGESILAVGAAVGACTTVVTSVRHRAGSGYCAEIDFISPAEWRAELAAIRDALLSPPSADDTEADREEWEEGRRIARETYRAVYQDDPPRDFARLLADPLLGLPEEIVEAMSADQPGMALEAKAAQTLRNTVRRYLVGRDQHVEEDRQLWPLISRVQIQGDFAVLANGVVFVDLPGLNDPNPARELVTRRYLEGARNVWLVCSSKVGIDRVITDILRDSGLFLRLFLEGRLGGFSIVTTHIDDMNVGAVLEQMGSDPESFDGDLAAPLEFHRRRIARHVQRHLLALADDLVETAGAEDRRAEFRERVRSLEVFSVSTAAYLHAVGRMPLYQGMKLSAEESHLPRLIRHLSETTLEESYGTQTEAACRRVQMVYEQIRCFFVDMTEQLERRTAAARREWAFFSEAASRTIAEGDARLQQTHVRFDEALEQACFAFERRMAELEARAERALASTIAHWERINWRSLQAAARRGGRWASRGRQRALDFNADIARTYLDLVPFVWEDFFAKRLGELIDEVADQAEDELCRTAAQLEGALKMLEQQPPGLRDSLRASLHTARESFALQSRRACAALMAEVQRSRQTLSRGMVETAAEFMKPAYKEASEVPGGAGIKRRMLDILSRHTERHAPTLFINMRQELAEGVGVLRGVMREELGSMVGQGSAILDRFRQNTSGQQLMMPELRDGLRQALCGLPPFTSDDDQDTPEAHRSRAAA